MLSGIGKVLYCKQQHFNGHPTTSKALPAPSVKPTQGWSVPAVFITRFKKEMKSLKDVTLSMFDSLCSEMCDVDLDGRSGGAVWQRATACIQTDGCSSVHQSSQNPPRALPTEHDQPAAGISHSSSSQQINEMFPF